MSYGDNPILARAVIDTFNTPIEIVPPVKNPYEISLILCPGGGALVYHQQSTETSAYLILGTGTDDIVFQSNHAGSGITLDVGDSLHVSAASSKIVTIYAAISVVPEEVF